MSDSPTPAEMEAITDALAAGQKIEAIKLYRSATDKGLKEAKEFVDALVTQLIEKDPEKFHALAARQSGGCATVIIALFCLGSAAALWTILLG